MAGFWPHAHLRFLSEREREEEESRTAQRSTETAGARTSHELDALEAGRREQL
jgi:hypothetical protein